MFTTKGPRLPTPLAIGAIIAFMIIIHKPEPPSSGLN